MSLVARCVCVGVLLCLLSVAPTGAVNSARLHRRVGVKEGECTKVNAPCTAKSALGNEFAGVCKRSGSKIECMSDCTKMKADDKCLAPEGKEGQCKASPRILKCIVPVEAQPLPEEEVIGPSHWYYIHTCDRYVGQESVKPLYDAGNGEKLSGVTGTYNILKFDSADDYLSKPEDTDFTKLATDLGEKSIVVAIVDGGVYSDKKANYLDSRVKAHYCALPLWQGYQPYDEAKHTEWLKDPTHLAEVNPKVESKYTEEDRERAKRGEKIEIMRFGVKYSQKDIKPVSGMAELAQCGVDRNPVVDTPVQVPDYHGTACAAIAAWGTPAIKIVDYAVNLNGASGLPQSVEVDRFKAVLEHAVKVSKASVVSISITMPWGYEPIVELLHKYPNVVFVASTNNARNTDASLVAGRLKVIPAESIPNLLAPGGATLDYRDGRIYEYPGRPYGTPQSPSKLIDFQIPSQCTPLYVTALAAKADELNQGKKVKVNCLLNEEGCQDFTKLSLKEENTAASTEKKPGISFGVPMAANVAAKMKLLCPILTGADVKRLMMQSAKPTNVFKVHSSTGGMLDPLTAYEKAADYCKKVSSIKKSAENDPRYQQAKKENVRKVGSNPNIRSPLKK